MRKGREKTVQAIILAGGKGTRLRPLTISTQKPVVPLANKPFLACQLDMLRRAGISELVLSLSCRPADVRNVMKASCPDGVNLRYVIENKTPGTGGGVRYAARVRSGTLVVFNGDGAKLRGALAGNRAKISAHTLLGGHAIPGDRAHLPEYGRIGGGDSGSLP